MTDVISQHLDLCVVVRPEVFCLLGHVGKVKTAHPVPQNRSLTYQFHCVLDDEHSPLRGWLLYEQGG